MQAAAMEQILFGLAGGDALYGWQVLNGTTILGVSAPRPFPVELR